MKINHLHLQNIRSYASQKIDFPEGIILIHGDNGAGKTSLLTGLFGGLFLSNIRSVGTNNFALDDLVRRGESKGVVELTFETGGTPYTVEWKLYTTSTPNDATLTSPALSEPVSGIRDVGREVRRLIGMDAEDFASSVYVKQGEIDRLIEATNRAAMIDGLLGLDEIDEYAQDMKMARRGVGRVRDSFRSRARERRNELEEFDRSEDEIEAAVAEASDKIRKVKGDLETLDEYLDRLREGRAELNSKIESYKETVEQKDKKERQIRKAKEKRAEAQAAADRKQKTIEDLAGVIEEEQEVIQDRAGAVNYDVSTPGAATAVADKVQEELTEAAVEVESRENELQQARDEQARIETHIEEAQDAHEECEEERDRLASQIEDKQEKLDEAKEDLERALADRNARAVNFLPEASDADAIDASAIDAVKERTGELRDRRGDVATNLAEEKVTRRERRAALRRLEEAQEDAEAMLQEKREELSALRSDLEAAGEAARERAETFEERRAALAERATEFDVGLSADNMQAAVNEVLPARKDKVTSRISATGRKISRFEQQIEQCRGDIEELQELGAEGKCPRCKQPVDETHVEEEVRELESEKQDLSEKLSAVQEEHRAHEKRRDKVEELRSAVTRLITFHQDEVESAESRCSELHVEVEAVKAEIAETREEQAERREEISALEDEIRGLDESIEELQAEHDALSRGIEAGESLIETFAQARTQQEQVEAREEDLQSLTSERDDVEEALQETETQIQALEGTLADQKEVVAGREDKLREAQRRVQELESAQSTIQAIVERYNEIDDKRSRIETKKQAIQHQRDVIDSCNERLEDLQEERDRLEKELGSSDIQELKERREKFNEKLSERKKTREELQEKRQSLHDERTGLERDLERLHVLKERIKTLDRKAEWAGSVHDELDDVLHVYEQAKSTLRKQYLAYINQYTNDVFQDLYLNSSYQRVLVEEAYDERRGRYDYAIRLERDDGTTEDPSNASGGERALVNLALRAGIYKLIAELEGGDHSRLPPFILDEPTTYLDDGHVGQLEAMLDRIRGWDVPQVIVVSHNPALIHGADHECRVEINDRTGTSRATMRTARIGGAEEVPA